MYRDRMGEDDGERNRQQQQQHRQEEEEETRRGGKRMDGTDHQHQTPPPPPSSSSSSSSNRARLPIGMCAGQSFSRSFVHSLSLLSDLIVDRELIEPRIRKKKRNKVMRMN